MKATQASPSRASALLPLPDRLEINEEVKVNSLVAAVLALAPRAFPAIDVPLRVCDVEVARFTLPVRFEALEPLLLEPAFSGDPGPAVDIGVVWTRDLLGFAVASDAWKGVAIVEMHRAGHFQLGSLGGEGHAAGAASRRLPRGSGCSRYARTAWA